MQIDRATIQALLLESLLTPRQAAQKVLSLGGGYALALPALGFVVVASAIISVLLSGLSADSGNADVDYLITQPLLLVLAQAAGTGVFAVLVAFVGRALGGRGRLDQVLLILAWLDFLLLAVQMAMLVALFAIPGLATPVVLFVGVIALWVMASFIAEVHGFKSTARTLAVLLCALFFLGIVLALLAPAMGGV